MQAISIARHGGPAVLEFRETDEPMPRAKEALVRVAAAGVNFIDVYHRSGQYPVGLPFVPGVEAAGTVVATGDEVTEVAVGDRVGWVMIPGGYAQLAAVPADRLIPIPDELDLKLAAAALLQGLTAHYLTESVHAAVPGEVALVHAAAGGVGQLLVQLLVRRGARVIATASTKQKLAIAQELGAEVLIPYRDEDFRDEVLNATDGKGVHVVYDGVGRSTFRRGLDVLRPRGSMVLYGAASGAPDPIDPIKLAEQGSLLLTRPSLSHYVATRNELTSRSDDLFLWLQDGELAITIDQTFAMEEAPAAHAYLEGRKTLGKVLLLPAEF